MPRKLAVTVVKLLKDATTAYRTHQANDGTKEIDPYNSLRFDEFGPSQEATNCLPDTDEKQKSENLGPDCLELTDSSRDDTDTYLNELCYDVQEIRETLVFTPNVCWRSAHNLVNQTDWANPSVKVATATPS